LFGSEIFETGHVRSFPQSFSNSIDIGLLIIDRVPYLYVIIWVLAHTEVVSDLVVYEGPLLARARFSDGKQCFSDRKTALQ